MLINKRKYISFASLNTSTTIMEFTAAMRTNKYRWGIGLGIGFMTLLIVIVTVTVLVIYFSNTRSRIETITEQGRYCQHFPHIWSLNT